MTAEFKLGYAILDIRADDSRLAADIHKARRTAERALDEPLTYKIIERVQRSTYAIQGNPRTQQIIKQIRDQHAAKMAESASESVALSVTTARSRDLTFELRNLAKGLMLVHAPMAYMAVDAAKIATGFSLLKGGSGAGGVLGGLAGGAAALGPMGIAGLAGAATLGIGAMAVKSANAAIPKPNIQSGEEASVRLAELNAKYKMQAYMLQSRMNEEDSRAALEADSKLKESQARLDQLEQSRRVTLATADTFTEDAQMRADLVKQELAAIDSEIQKQRELVLLEEKQTEEVRRRIAERRALELLGAVGLTPKDQALREARERFVANAIGLPSAEQAAAARATQEAQAARARDAIQNRMARGQDLLEMSESQRVNAVRDRFISQATGLPEGVVTAQRVRTEEKAAEAAAKRKEQIERRQADYIRRAGMTTSERADEDQLRLIAASSGLPEELIRAKVDAARRESEQNVKRVSTTDPMGFARMLQESLGGETKKQTELLKAIKENTAKDGAAKVGAPKSNKGKV